jgi:hypothetical protein
MSNDYEYCLLLGGDYHGKVITQPRSLIQARIMMPKLLAIPDDPIALGGTEVIDDITYRVEWYLASDRLTYLIAACQALKSFDIESEIHKAHLPHFPEPCRRPTPDELHWQAMNGVGYFDRRNRHR